MKTIFIILYLTIQVYSINAQTNFTKEELTVLQGAQDEKLRTLLITNKADSIILRKKCLAINPKDPNLNFLWKLMLNTVNDSLNQGVGIAAPQIGINRQIILVQRFDKPHQPFEFILNPKIIWQSNLIQNGREGCLSIPDEMGMVDRYYTIKIVYQNITGKWVEETIEGFTAVIFQHEIDHLNGILFTDRIVEQNQKSYYINNQQFKFISEQNTR